MPTKPSKNTSKKHGKAFLNEAVAKSGYYRKPITKKRAITAGVVAILLFGSVGIHDFIMQNRKRGLIHMFIGTIAFGMFFVPLCYGISVVYRCRDTGECIDISSYDDTLNAILVAGIFFFLASTIWGIVEGIIILTHLGRFVDKTTDKK